MLAKEATEAKAKMLSGLSEASLMSEGGTAKLKKKVSNKIYDALTYAFRGPRPSQVSTDGHLDRGMVGGRRESHGNPRHHTIAVRFCTQTIII